MRQRSLASDAPDVLIEDTVSYLVNLPDAQLYVVAVVVCKRFISCFMCASVTIICVLMSMVYL